MHDWVVPGQEGQVGFVTGAEDDGVNCQARAIFEFNVVVFNVVVQSTDKIYRAGV